MVGIEVELELVGDDASREDRLVLGLVAEGEEDREQFGCPAADDVLPPLPPEPPDESLVGIPVASRPVLHEKHDIRERIEQALEIREGNLLHSHRVIMPESAGDLPTPAKPFLPDRDMLAG